MDAISLAIFAGALALASGSPGPSIAALVARVLSRGARDVTPFLAAFWIGEVLWLTAAVAGLSALAETFHTGFLVIRYLGIAYLIWLAIDMWRAAGAEETAQLPTASGGWSMFGAGLALTLGNPKIMVFYLALLPSLVDLGAIGLADWAALALVTLGVVVAVDLTWVLAAERARRLLAKPQAQRIANRVSALTMGSAAGLIAARAP